MDNNYSQDNLIITLKKILLFCIVTVTLLILLITPLNAGRYAGDFMEIGSGVRALGLSGSFTAIADDGSAIYWNAAGIAQLKQIEIGIMRSYLYNGLAYYDHLTYCQPLPNDATIGINWTRLSIPDVPVFDEKHLIGTSVDQRVTYSELHLTGVPDDFFTAYDDLIQFAFAKHLQFDLNLGWGFFKLPVDLHLGGNMKYIRRTIQDYTGTGTGFDLSMLIDTELSNWFDVKWFGDFAIGLNFQNLGNTAIIWDTVSKNKDEILLNTKLGFAYTQPLESLSSNIIITTDTDFNSYDRIQRFGLEYQYDQILAGRIGYSNKNMSSGLTVSFFDLNIDYAFVTNVLGNSHRVGLRVYF